MEYTCARCGQKIAEQNHIIQDIVYLGKSKPRQLLCDKCYESFTLWFNNYEGKEE